jgi:hypothetical protein
MDSHAASPWISVLAQRLQRLNGAPSGEFHFWKCIHKRFTAVNAADVAGSSRLIGDDEERRFTPLAKSGSAYCPVHRDLFDRDCGGESRAEVKRQIAIPRLRGG